MWLTREDRLTLEELKDLKKVLKELKLDRTLATRELELSKEIVSLKTQISELEIQRAKLKEEHANHDRELRHMIGQEKKRQEGKLLLMSPDVELQGASLNACVRLQTGNQQPSSQLHFWTFLSGFWYSVSFC